MYPTIKYAESLNLFHFANGTTGVKEIRTNKINSSVQNKIYKDKTIIDSNVYSNDEGD